MSSTGGCGCGVRYDQCFACVPRAEYLMPPEPRTRIGCWLRRRLMRLFTTDKEIGENRAA